MSSTLFENRNVTIAYDNDKEYLLIKWNGLMKSDEFREAAREILKAIEQTQTKSILSDNTDWRAISPNDHGWAAYNWFPEAEAKGVRRLATVLSRDYFNRAAEKSIEGMAEVQCLEIKNFKALDDAFVWLSKNRTAQNCT
jgi:hypothetical protein